MKRLVSEVKAMVTVELINANKDFPMFRSTHEGYAIIKEEVEEAEIEMKSVKCNLEYSWELIKNNVSALGLVKQMQNKATLLAAESIQTAAMCQKFIDSELSEVNK